MVGGHSSGKECWCLEWPGLGSGVAIVPQEKVIRKWNLDQLTAGFVQGRVGQEKCFWKLFHFLCSGDLNSFLQTHAGGDHICLYMWNIYIWGGGGLSGGIYWKRRNLQAVRCLTWAAKQIYRVQYLFNKNVTPNPIWNMVQLFVSLLIIPAIYVTFERFLQLC